MRGPLAIVAAGCLMGCFLLPWAVEEGAEQVAKAVARAGAHPTEEEAHACCGSDGEPTMILVPCKSDGTLDPSGDHLCCHACSKVCGKRPKAERRAPGPVPVPVPPDCDLMTHCKSKEECVIGGGHCCSKCKGACL